MTDTPAAHYSLVLGATSSLGQALCRQLAARGDRLMLVGRDSEALERMAEDLRLRYEVEVSLSVCDLSRPIDGAAIAPEIDRAYLLAGDMGQTNARDEPAEIVRMISVNFSGPAGYLAILAQQMEQRDGGAVAVVGSVAGDRGRQSNYLYGSSKGGLALFADGTRHRYAASTVHVMTVKPGFIDTPMTYGMQSRLIADREAVAAAIIHALEKKRDCLYVPAIWRIIMLIIRHIPERLFKKMRL